VRELYPLILADLRDSVATSRHRSVNAVAESFFSSLKKEPARQRIYKTRELARADIFDYIEVFYNRTRRHSHLGGVSPEAFERASV
jgi:putative transposase